METLLIPGPRNAIERKKTNLSTFILMISTPSLAGFITRTTTPATSSSKTPATPLTSLYIAEDAILSLDPTKHHDEGIEGNEQADEAARHSAERGGMKLDAVSFGRPASLTSCE